MYATDKERYDAEIETIARNLEGFYACLAKMDILDAGVPMLNGLQVIGKSITGLSEGMPKDLMATFQNRLNQLLNVVKACFKRLNERMNLIHEISNVSKAVESNEEHCAHCEHCKKKRSWN